MDAKHCELAVSMRVGQRLKDIRLILGLSLKDIGDKIGVGYQQIHKYERGIGGITTQVLTSIAHHIRLSPFIFTVGLDRGGPNTVIYCKKIRDDLGLTVGDFAILAGRTQQNVRKREQRNSPLTVDLLRRIAQGVGRHPWSLVDPSGAIPPQGGNCPPPSPSPAPARPNPGGLGGRLKSIRLARGLTQAQLAGAIGASFQQIQKYESGAANVAVTRLIALSAKLQIPPEILIQPHLQHEAPWEISPDGLREMSKRTKAELVRQISISHRAFSQDPRKDSTVTVDLLVRLGRALDCHPWSLVEPG